MAVMVECIAATAGGAGTATPGTGRCCCLPYSANALVHQSWSSSCSGRVSWTWSAERLQFLKQWGRRCQVRHRSTPEDGAGGFPWVLMTSSNLASLIRLAKGVLMYRVSRLRLRSSSRFGR